MASFEYDTTRQVVEVPLHVHLLYQATGGAATVSGPMPPTAGTPLSLARRAAHAALVQQYPSIFQHGDQTLVRQSDFTRFQTMPTPGSYRPIEESELTVGLITHGHPTADESSVQPYPHVHHDFRGNGCVLATPGPPRRRMAAPRVRHASHVTTLMLKNIPGRYSIEDLVETLQHTCAIRAVEDYDFLYLPMDFRQRKNRGFGFINFTSAENAESFREQVVLARAGGREPILNKYPTDKVLEVTRANTQGRDANIISYLRSEASTSIRGVWNPWFRPVLFLGSVETLDTGLHLRLFRLPNRLNIRHIYSFMRARGAVATAGNEEVVDAEGYAEAVTADVDDFLRGMRRRMPRDLDILRP